MQNDTGTVTQSPSDIREAVLVNCRTVKLARTGNHISQIRVGTGDRLRQHACPAACLAPCAGRRGPGCRRKITGPLVSTSLALCQRRRTVAHRLPPRTSALVVRVRVRAQTASEAMIRTRGYRRRIGRYVGGRGRRRRAIAKLEPCYNSARAIRVQRAAHKPYSSSLRSGEGA